MPRMIFKAIEMPDPQLMTVRVEKPNGDVITYCNAAHISPEMAEAISGVAQWLLDRRVWQLRKLQRGHNVGGAWLLTVLAAGNSAGSDAVARFGM